MTNNFAVIIPSYNESENLKILVKKIRNLYPTFKIFIIDDSKSEENEKIKKAIRLYSNVKLISRMRKSGRGSAVMLGFKEAYKLKNIQYFLEMDSDLAHDPVEIKRFLEKSKTSQYDLIIGSRYLKGSKIKNITKNRTILSRVINFYLKFWLNVRVSDFTSGFRLYSRKSVSFLLKTKIESKGFITLSEVLYKINKQKYIIAEVPITWNYRIYGKSNVNIQELLVSLFYVIKLRLSK